MAFTLSDVLISSLDRLGKLNEGTATGGSTSTLVDSTQTSQLGRFTDDVLGGVMFVTYDVAGTGVAPEKEYSKITAFTESTGTYAGTFTVAPASGDRYAWANGEYPLEKMIGLVNEALQELGQVRCVDTTTLDTDSTHTEYAVSVDWKYRVEKVEIQGLTADAYDNQWYPIHGWKYVTAAGGTAGRLIFEDYPYNSRDIKVTYYAPHPKMTVYTSVINEEWDRELVVRAVVARALEWNNNRINGSNKYLVQAWNMAEQKLAERKLTHPVERGGTRNILWSFGDTEEDEGDEFSAPG
jgi:hypothetical protein